MLRTYVPIRSHSEVFGVRVSTYHFWRNTVQPIITWVTYFYYYHPILGYNCVSDRNVVPHTVLCVDPRWSKSVFCNCYRKKKELKNGKGWKFLSEMLETKLIAQELAHKLVHYLWFKKQCVVTATLPKSSRLCYQCGKKWGWLVFNQDNKKCSSALFCV